MPGAIFLRAKGFFLVVDVKNVASERKYGIVKHFEYAIIGELRGRVNLNFYLHRVSSFSSEFFPRAIIVVIK